MPAVTGMKICRTIRQYEAAPEDGCDCETPNILGPGAAEGNPAGMRLDSSAKRIRDEVEHIGQLRCALPETAGKYRRARRRYDLVDRPPLQELGCGKPCATKHAGAWKWDRQRPNRLAVWTDCREKAKSADVRGGIAGPLPPEARTVLVIGTKIACRRNAASGDVRAGAGCSFKKPAKDAPSCRRDEAAKKRITHKAGARLIGIVTTCRDTQCWKQSSFTTITPWKRDDSGVAAVKMGRQFAGS